jgi:hypothetical protein
MPREGSCIQAAVKVMARARRPMGLHELYDAITKSGGWRGNFSTLSVQMRRSSVGFDGSRPIAEKLFRHNKTDGTFSLLSSAGS